MKLLAIEEKDIETVYLFGDNELEQMLVQDGDLKKQIQVRRNNLISNKIIIIKSFI